MNDVPILCHALPSDHWLTMCSAEALTLRYSTQIILLTSHTRIESTNDRYKDMIMQKTMTTVVDPIVSARVGNDTFFNSPRTSIKNSLIESTNFLNMRTSPSP